MRVGTLGANTTGTGNNAFGKSALSTVTTGTGNTAIGFQTGWGITTGNFNTVVGTLVQGLAPGLSGAVILASGQAGNGLGIIRADFGNTHANYWTFSAPIVSPIYTVATLPAPVAGARAFVSDSNATLAAGLGNVVAAGGSNFVPVYNDGTNWRIG